ncbi:MAG: C-GCAxxG-C-C family protein [Clostridia bacterium]|nr:C-GCAxxG-C-C family protein [Clostridia bacterium]
MDKLTEDRANELMNGGFHCSQAVAEHIAAKFGLDREFWLRLTAGLGGGCNHGDTCGAIAAATLGLGLAYGFDQENAEEQDTILKEKVRELQARFIAKHGAVLCRELLNGYDNADPNRVSNDDTWAKCGLYCEDAAAIMDSLIEE